MNIKTKLIFISIGIILITLPSFCQGTLLIIPNNNGKVVIDGTMEEILEKAKPKKFTLSKGDHYIQFLTIGGLLKDEVVTIEEGAQKILKIDFQESKENTQLIAKGFKPILVANLELSLTPLVLKDGTNSTEVFYYAFEEGDELVIDAKILNKKGNFFVKIRSHPDGTLIYSNQKTGSINNHKIKIPKRGIYILDFWTNAIFGKRIQLAIKRIPANPTSANFNTTVELKTKYEAVSIIDPTSQYLNSTSNETVWGGNNEVTVSVKLPPNTVEWHYIFSATRNKAEIANLNKTFNLFGDLSKALLGANGKLISLGMDVISVPPGANYCDVYVLDQINQQAFLDDLKFSYYLDGSRENLKQGKSKIPCSGNKNTYFLGFQNRHIRHGLHIAYEVVAIVKSTYLEAVELIE